MPTRDTFPWVKPARRPGEPDARYLKRREASRLAHARECGRLFGASGGRNTSPAATAARKANLVKACAAAQAAALARARQELKDMGYPVPRDPAEVMRRIRTLRRQLART
jgi:hypothetical protein